MLFKFSLFGSWLVGDDLLQWNQYFSCLQGTLWLKCGALGSWADFLRINFYVFSKKNSTKILEMLENFWC